MHNKDRITKMTVEYFFIVIHRLFFMLNVTNVGGKRKEILENREGEVKSIDLKKKERECMCVRVCLCVRVCPCMCVYVFACVRVVRCRKISFSQGIF